MTERWTQRSAQIENNWRSAPDTDGDADAVEDDLSALRFTYEL
jgi:hypothetical protein